MPIAGVGFLSQVERQVRRILNDPGDSAVLQDPDLISEVRWALIDVMGEINRSNGFKPIAEFNIAIVADQRFYALPPTIGQFLELAEIDPQTGGVISEVIPRNFLHPYGRGVAFQDNTLVIDPPWKEGKTLRMSYVPMPDSPIVECVGTTWTSTSVIRGSDVAGTLDRRIHAYAGYTLRTVGGSDVVQDERQVTAYDSTLKKFTVAPNFIIATGNFEVVPHHAYRLLNVIALRVAVRNCSIVVDPLKRNGIKDDYQDAMRGLRLDGAQAEQRVGRRFQRGVRGRLFRRSY